MPDKLVLQCCIIQRDIQNHTHTHDAKTITPVVDAGCKNNVFIPADLDLWPMTLIFKVHLGVIRFHILTKIRNPRCNTSWDMRFLYFFNTDMDMHRWAQKLMCTKFTPCPLQMIDGICYRKEFCLIGWGPKYRTHKHRIILHHMINKEAFGKRDK